MLAPAIVHALWNLGSNGELNGWAIPTATDIAFAVAVLAVISPPSRRAADLPAHPGRGRRPPAITIIAVLHHRGAPGVASRRPLSPIVVFAVLVQRRIWSACPVVPPARLRGLDLRARVRVHATVAGCRPRVHGARAPRRRPVGSGPRQHREHPSVLSRPASPYPRSRSSPPVTIGGWDGLVSVVAGPGLPGHRHRPRGRQSCNGTVGLTRPRSGPVHRAELDGELSWSTSSARRCSPTGFTVSPLIGELGARQRIRDDDHDKVAARPAGRRAPPRSCAPATGSHRRLRAGGARPDADAPTSRTGPQRPLTGRKSRRSTAPHVTTRPAGPSSPRPRRRPAGPVGGHDGGDPSTVSSAAAPAGATAPSGGSPTDLPSRRRRRGR